MPDRLLVDAVVEAVSSVGHGKPQGSGRLWVGYSGGADSTALLVATQTAYPDRVCALHVDHQLHPASADWARRCDEFCTTRHIPIEIRVVRVSSGNVEGAARASRYQVFDDLIASGEMLLLAHHLDDQSETLLLRLFQGRGLLPMAAVRRLQSGALVVRPFLHIRGEHLRSVLLQDGISWLTDPSNEQDSLDRNYLRNRVLPVIRQRWPDVDERLDRVAGYQAGLETLATRWRGESIGVEELGAVPAAEACADLRLWLRGLGEYQVTDRALLEYVVQAASPSDRQPYLRLIGGSLRRYRQRVYYVADLKPHAPSYVCDPQTLLALPHGSLSVSSVVEGGFAAAGELEICFDRPQARIKLSRGSKTAGRVLEEGGVPPWLRPHYPLLFCQDQLVAIPGFAHHQHTGPGWIAQWRFDSGQDQGTGLSTLDHKDELP